MSRASDWPEKVATPPGVVDPTGDLLRQITGVESKVPWIPLGIAVICILWLPGIFRLDSTAVRPAEVAWVAETLASPGANPGRSLFSREFTRATWEWQGAEITSEDLTPPQRTLARLPSLAAGLAALIVFFFLSRLVIGNAAALLAATLLAVATPWVRAGTSISVLMLGEMFVLFGVTWAVTLQTRHREVQLAGVTATRVGFAGIFLGIGLLLAPAGIATIFTTLLIWLLLGLRRSSSDATTLPVGRPSEITFFAIVGTILLLGGTAFTAWGVERLLGGGVVTFASALPPAANPDLWVDVYRRLLSPGPTTDVLLALTITIVGTVRAAEWHAGRPWQAAGLLPWLFLVLWVLAVQRDGVSFGTLDVPLTVPPLFVLGGAWLVLRGLRPGVIRRQEYTFLVTWVLMGALLVPLVSGGHPHDPVMAASVALLPPMLMIVGRGARALWEAEKHWIARVSVLIIAYVPVVVFLLLALDQVAVSGLPSVGRAGLELQGQLPWVVLGAAGLGMIAEIVTVRPDRVFSVPHGLRGGPGRSRRGRRGSGGRRGGRSGGRSRGGARRSGRG